MNTLGKRSGEKEAGESLLIPMKIYMRIDDYNP